MRKCCVFYDLDGVIFDFDYALMQLMGMNYLDASKADKWKAVNAAKDFFLNLPLINGAEYLWHVIPTEDRYVLSAIAKSVPNCALHKMQSLRRHFTIHDDQIILVNRRQDKQLYCLPGDILIDDREDNIEDWNKAGGVGILFLNTTQAINDLREAYYGK